VCEEADLRVRERKVNAGKVLKIVHLVTLFGRMKRPRKKISSPPDAEGRFVIATTAQKQKVARSIFIRLSAAACVWCH
jgi:hypothetical protein